MALRALLQMRIFEQTTQKPKSAVILGMFFVVLLNTTVNLFSHIAQEEEDFVLACVALTAEMDVHLFSRGIKTLIM